MAKYYDYALAVWLKIERTQASPVFLEEFREHLEAEYQILQMESVEESDEDEGFTISLRLQLTFDESNMERDEPTDGALADLDMELRAYIETKYQVNYLEILDDALTSYLLDEREEPEQRKYPEPKQRNLTDVEKVQMRERIERGDTDIYVLAAEFRCSPSQIAGIKAAMHR